LYLERLHGSHVRVIDYNKSEMKLNGWVVTASNVCKYKWKLFFGSKISKYSGMAAALYVLEIYRVSIKYFPE